MSGTIISLSADIKKLKQLAEDGELTDEEIADTIQGMEGELSDRLDKVYALCRIFDGNVVALDDEGKRLTERKKHFESEGKRLKKYILDCMTVAGKKTVKTTFNTFSVRKAVDRLIIDDEALIGDDFVSTEVITRVDKAAVKEAVKKAIEEGISFSGAHLEEGEASLQVR